MQFFSQWTGPTLPSVLPQGTKRKVISAVFIVVGILWLMTPRLYGDFTQHVHKEDGLVFLSGVFSGENLFTTYTGYLHVGPRLAATLCAATGPDFVSPCLSAATSLWRGCLSILILAVLLPYVRSWGWALAAAGLPLYGAIGQQEVLGNVTNLRWFFDLFVVFALLGVFNRWTSIVIVSLGVWLSVLSDPLTLALFPVALWRILSLQGKARVVPLLFLPTALLHILALDSGARKMHFADIFTNPVIMVQNIVVRSASEAILGESGSQLAVNLFGPLVVTLATILAFGIIFAVCFRNLPIQAQWLVVLLGIGAVCFATATLTFVPAESVDVGQGIAMGSRYALIPSIMLGASLAVTFSHQPPRLLNRFIVVITSALVVVGAIVDSRGDEWATRGPTWHESVMFGSEECASETSGTVTIEVTPQGVPKKWDAAVSCEWLEGAR